MRMAGMGGVDDAKKTLTGGDDSVTQFFKAKTSDP